MLSFSPLNFIDCKHDARNTFFYIWLDLTLHWINLTVYKTALFIFHAKTLGQALLCFIQFITQMTSYVTPVQTTGEFVTIILKSALFKPKSYSLSCTIPLYYPVWDWHKLQWGHISLELTFWCEKTTGIYVWHCLN